MLERNNLKDNRIERNSVSLCSILEDRIQEIGLDLIGVTSRLYRFRDNLSNPDTMAHYLFTVSELNPSELINKIGIRYNGIRDVESEYDFDKKLKEFEIEKQISYFLKWDSLFYCPTDCTIVSVRKDKRRDVEKFILKNNEMIRKAINLQREHNSYEER